MRHAVDILFLLSLGLGATTLGFAVAWIRARERAIRMEGLLDGLRAATPAAAPAGAALSAARSDLAPALDAIAMEVERIGEGQRFLTSILAEQQARRIAPPRAPESITPH
jgi:hypothetical protein